MNFRSYGNGSDGMCMAFWNKNTNIFIDAGIQRQYRVKDILKAHKSASGGLPDAVVCSHRHVDHLRMDFIKVLDTTYYVPEKALVGRPNASHEVIYNDVFTVGDITITPIQTEHHPDFKTYAFILKDGETKSVVHVEGKPKSYLEPYYNCDFMYVEANHSKTFHKYITEELLVPNPNTNYHLTNVQAGFIIGDVIRGSKKEPIIRIGNISDKRNTDVVAMNEILRATGYKPKTIKRNVYTKTLSY